MSQIHCYCSLYIDVTLQQISLIKATNCNIYLMSHCHICARKNMPLKCYIGKLIHMHIWVKFINIYVSYRLTGINNVTRNTSIHTLYIILHMPLNKFACYIANIVVDFSPHYYYSLLIYHL